MPSFGNDANSTALEKKSMNGWSAATAFEGEYSNVTSTYVGEDVVRHTR
jgi:hypothetical protein